MEEAETSVRRRFWAALQTSHYCPLLVDLGCRNQSTMARRQINPRLGISCSIEFIRSGRLRAAVAAATRSPAPPDVPSIGAPASQFGLCGVISRVGEPPTFPRVSGQW